MKTYLISYDLRSPETSEDYKRLISYIKSFNKWATPLKSVWFIQTLKAISDVRSELHKNADSNDGILVIDITKDDWATQGIGADITTWMKSNI